MIAIVIVDVIAVVEDRATEIVETGIETVNETAKGIVIETETASVDLDDLGLGHGRARDHLTLLHDADPVIAIDERTISANGHLKLR